MRLAETFLALPPARRARAFGVIDRFSEVIDLCLVPEFVGADAAGFDALTSRGKRDNRCNT